MRPIPTILYASLVPIVYQSTDFGNGISCPPLFFSNTLVLSHHNFGCEGVAECSNFINRAVKEVCQRRRCVLREKLHGWHYIGLFFFLSFKINFEHKEAVVDTDVLMNSAPFISRLRAEVCSLLLSSVVLRTSRSLVMISLELARSGISEYWQWTSVDIICRILWAALTSPCSGSSSWRLKATNAESLCILDLEQRRTLINRSRPLGTPEDRFPCFWTGLKNIFCRSFQLFARNGFKSSQGTTASLLMRPLCLFYWNACSLLVLNFSIPTKWMLLPYHFQEFL